MAISFETSDHETQIPNPLALSPDEREDTAAERWAAINAYRIKQGMDPIKFD